MKPPLSETQIGTIAIEQELLNGKQVQHCRQVCEERRSQGDPADIGQIMVELGYLTNEQIKAVRAEARRRQCRIRGYEIIDRVGEGSVGAVYRARQVAMDRDVALKILHPHLAQDREVVKRYISEARAVAKLNHPHIVQGIDVGESDGYYYFAMEYLGGGTFFEMMENSGPLPEENALIFLYQVTSALKHAWERKIIHCDIKPANLMLDSAGRLKLTDLGLARFGHSVDLSGDDGKRVIRGTPHYLSPEQIESPDSLDCRTDIYSLGATFYHLACGRTPFEGESTKALILQRLKSDPPPLDLMADVSKEFVSLIRTMMARKRDDRFQSPEELMQAIVDMGVDMRKAGDLVAAIEHTRSSRRMRPAVPRKTPASSSRRPAAQRQHGHSSRLHRMPKAPGNNLIWLIVGLALIGVLLILGLSGILSSSP